MTDYDKLVAAQDDTIARRRGALARRKEGSGEKAGLLGERRLRKLIKQAQRRKAKLVKDRARRAGTRAGAD